MNFTEITSKVLVSGLLVLAMSDVNHIRTIDNNISGVYNRNIYININNKLSNIKKNTISISKRTAAAERSSRSGIIRTKIMKIARGIREVESHGNYKADSRWSSACGAYQYITSTWNDYKGYNTACDAPAKIQDQRMIRDLYIRFERYGGDWQKMIAAHLYPAYANDKSKWNRDLGGNPTLNQYVRAVMKEARI